MLVDYRKACEGAIADLLPTVRAVVLEDYSFSAIAVERFGGCKQKGLVQEESRGGRLHPTSQPAPRCVRVNSRG
jgi:hypothetical protein